MFPLSLSAVFEREWQSKLGRYSGNMPTTSQATLKFERLVQNPVSVFSKLFFSYRIIVWLIIIAVSHSLSSYVSSIVVCSAPSSQLHGCFRYLLLGAVFERECSSLLPIPSMIVIYVIILLLPFSFSFLFLFALLNASDWFLIPFSSSSFCSSVPVTRKFAAKRISARCRWVWYKMASQTMLSTKRLRKNPYACDYHMDVHTMLVHRMPGSKCIVKNLPLSSIAFP